MHSTRPVPRAGEVFLDARGSSRSLRVSWHDDAGLVVLSLWRSGVCTGTFRLRADEVPDLVEVLRRGLRASYDAVHVTGHTAGHAAGHAAGHTGVYDAGDVAG